MRKSRIDNGLLIALINQGMKQKDIASRFGVSPPAICKRLKTLSSMIEPESLNKLTEKERRFVIEKSMGKTNIQAVVDSYEVTSLKSAKTIGCNLMKKPEIREAIDDLMENEGIGRRERVRKLKKFIDDPNSHVGIRALDMGFKLGNDYPAQKTLNLNANVPILPVDLSRYRNDAPEPAPDTSTNDEVIDVVPEEPDEKKSIIEKYRNRN